jgi:hypothetical protein
MITILDILVVNYLFKVLVKNLFEIYFISNITFYFSKIVLEGKNVSLCSTIL